LVSTLLFALLLCVSAVAQTQQKPEQLAQQSSDAWLALVDSGKYADSWDEAAQMFKSAVTKDQWQSALGQVRTPQGKVLARKLKSATYTKTLPNAPDGEYVVIQYDTNFERKQGAAETVVPMLDKDGKWRVSGYFIK
jgi:predicted SnoaL-like aldol condensation-catalyzing enzyme